ncbi:uncharacterized protein LOC6526075 [Drosophila yakuba]|uniref:Uncharacterized protein n=1 Tax=Drosophila yakuba TaxID=7245 RepID=B4PY28_DROYA|nr:uncharacterized protein LOC6526075 [Drosophila yakuba]EDX03000.1 uncharacterized protein Dyak_GE15353 [Drosophila yakuba]
MPNQSKASSPGIKETPSCSHHEFLMQEQPQQPRGSKVASTQTQDWPSDMVDQLTGAQDSPSDMVGQLPGAQDSPSNMVDKLPGAQDSPSDMVDKLPGAQDSPSNMVNQSTQTDLSKLFMSGEDDINLQLGTLGLRKRVAPEEDPTGDLTAVPEQNRNGNPLAKRQKVEGTQYRHNDPSFQEWSSTQTTDSSSLISLANLIENGSVSNVEDQESRATGGEDVESG